MGFVAQLSKSTGLPVFSSLIGGNGNSYISGISVDAAGNSYVVGSSDSPGLPLTGGNSSYQQSWKGQSDAIVAIISPTGQLNYSTYLGASGFDVGEGIALASNNSFSVVGRTASVEFPVTPGFTQTVSATESFVTRFTVPPVPAPQTIGSISFSPVSLTVGGTTTVSARSTSGLPVSYSSITPAICGVSNSTVSGIGIGTCTVAANQAGNADYAPAPPIMQSVTVDPPPVPAISLNPTVLSFADQYVGTTSMAQTVIVANTGAGALRINGILPTANAFAVTHNCGLELAARGSCRLNVTFSPLDSGTRIGAISINTNAAGSPHNVIASGVGVAINTPICTLTATPPTVRKNGASILTANCTPMATSYTWTGGTCQGNVASTCTVTPTFTTAYSVSGTNRYGVSSTSSATVTVRAVDLTPILMLLLD